MGQTQNTAKENPSVKAWRTRVKARHSGGEFRRNGKKEQFLGENSSFSLLALKDHRDLFKPWLVGFLLSCGVSGAPAILGHKYNGLMPVLARVGGDRKIRNSVSALVI